MTLKAPAEVVTVWWEEELYILKIAHKRFVTTVHQQDYKYLASYLSRLIHMNNTSEEKTDTASSVIVAYNYSYNNRSFLTLRATGLISYF